MNNNFWSKFPYTGVSTFIAGVAMQVYGSINLLKLGIILVESGFMMLVDDGYDIEDYILEMTLDYASEAIFAQIFMYLIITVFGLALITAGANMCKAAGGFAVTQNNTTNQAITDFVQNKQSDKWDCPECGAENISSSAYCYNCGTKKVTSNTKITSSNGEWICKKCGRINQNYVGTCGCGEIKPR